MGSWEGGREVAAAVMVVIITNCQSKVKGVLVRDAAEYWAIRRAAWFGAMGRLSADKMIDPRVMAAIVAVTHSFRAWKEKRRGCPAFAYRR